jgi:copper transport protein
VPAAASAHARLVGSKPAAGAVLATAPRDVRLQFDDEIRPAGGDRAVDAAGRSVLAGRARRQGTRVLVVPLRAGLPNGAYTVRWRVISNDGHLETGVLAFAVGAGSPTPKPTLSAGGGTSGWAVLLRVLFLGGMLVAGGAALTGWRIAGRRAERLAIAAGLAAAAAGGFGLLALQPVGGTRFGEVTKAAAIAAAAGAVVALVPPLLPLARVLAVLELAAPTLAGHSLDPRHLRWLIALADLVHVAAAAAWIGGLVLLVAGRGRRDRFRPIAIGSLVVLGIGAIARAIAAFPTLASVVHTSYGQAVLVKTGLLVAVLAVAWLNRRRLESLGLAAEVALLAGVVVAVGVLTQLPPPPRATAAVAKPAPPAPPPPDAVVLAGEDDDVAVGLAVSPRGGRIAARVTALGEDGNGVDGLRVRIGGVDAQACGAGCYAATVPLPPPPRRLPVSLEGSGAKPATLAFTLPRRWPAPDATALVTRVDRVFRSLRTVVIHEHLASNAHNGLDTVYHLEAPNRMSYDIRNGPDAIVIGATRWDRDSARAPWVKSQQEPIRQPQPFWGSDPRRNARLLGPDTASFYDPRLPAWFVVTVDPRTGRLLRLHMTAQAHFMRHRYSGFDAPFAIRPPPKP